MISSEYLTAGGYITDGDILCVNCGEKRKLPVAAQITLAQIESDFFEDGVWCGDCGVEPPEPVDVEYEYELDDDGSYNENEGGDLETD